MPSPSDPVYACLQIETTCGVAQTSTSERVYRDAVSATGEWHVGDTLKLKLQFPATACRLFGWERAEILTSSLSVKTAEGTPVAGVVAGLGTIEATFTLTGTAPPGASLTVGYRTGVPGVYTKLAEDRGNDEINLHAVDLDNPVVYVEVYGRSHPWSGNPELPDILRVTGMGLQTNPPA